MATRSKLAVILHADVVGSTDLVHMDERLAHDRIQDAFRRFSDTVLLYHGNAHELRGDALVAEFDRASDAVTAALAFQVANSSHNQAVADDIRPRIRVGVALGEVVIANQTVTGAGVVLAQRIEQLAPPGGVCISAAIREAVPGRLPYLFEDLGEHALKGFDLPQRVHTVRLAHANQVPPPEDGPEGQTEVGASDQSGGQVTVAVLPFKGSSGDPEQDALGEGIAEDVIAALSRHSFYKVLSRNASFAYRDGLADPSKVGAELGADYVLDGNTRQAGNRIRVSAQLVDCASGEHVWAERYDRDGSDLFAVQDEIAQRAASTLDEVLWQDTAQRAGRKRLEDFGYYDHIYRGMEHLHRIAPADAEKARAHFEQALALDLNLPDAHLVSGFCHLHFWQFWCDPKGDSLQQASSFAQRTLEFSPEAAQTYRLLSRVDIATGDFDQALKRADRALGIDPDDGDIIGNRGLAALAIGQTDDAVHRFEQVLALHAHTPYTTDVFTYYLAMARFTDERFEEAIAGLRELGGMHALKHQLLAACYSCLGRTTEAAAEATTSLGAFPRVRVERLGYWRCFASEGTRERLREALLASGLPP